MKQMNFFTKIALVAVALAGLILSACVRDPKNEGSKACTPEEMQYLVTTVCMPTGTGTTYVDGFSYDVSIKVDNSILEAQGIKITKVEFYLDDDLLATKTSAPYNVSSGQEKVILEAGTHILKALIYASSGGNSICVEKTIREISIVGEIDCYLDYNIVGEGDTFTISACINEEKSPAGSYIKSFTGTWGYTPMEAVAPLTLSHVVTDIAGTERDVNLVVQLSNGTTQRIKLYSRVFTSENSIGKNVILSNTKNFKQSHTLKCKAQVYQGKDCPTTKALEVYFDDKKVGETNVFPYITEVPLADFAKGSHTLRSVWKNLGENGSLLNSTETTETITIE